MDVANEFIARSRHYLAYEYPAKIRLCLEALPADALWRRDDDASNSIGNLLLHLAGNVRQWLVSGVGGAPDSRYRLAEFEAREGGDAAALLAGLQRVVADADVVLAALTPARLADRFTVQGREVTVLDAVYHVVEHFAMHTGQILLLAKRYAPGRIHFYDDAGGLATPRWRDQ